MVRTALLFLTACVLVAAVSLRATIRLDASPRSSIAPTARQDLPTGEGWDAVERVCSDCHDLTFTISTHASEDEWVLIFNDMISKGADGSDEDFDLALTYLMTHRGEAGMRPAETHVDLALLADRTKVAPGERFTLGLRVVAEPGWQVKSAAGSEQLTLVTWTTPPGVSIGRPLPASQAPGVLTFFPAELSAERTTGTVELRALVNYQVCQVQDSTTCAAETATVSASLPIGPGGVADHTEAFSQLRSRPHH